MGKILEYIKMALQNIRGNKGRSFLTMLGIIIGISSVITIVSIGEGTKNQMNAEVDAVGTGQIYVHTAEEAIGANVKISKEDMVAIKSEIDGVLDVTPSLYASGAALTGKGEFGVDISGGSEAYKEAMNFDIKRGNYFTEADVENANQVCVVSDKDAKRLFGSDDVIGMDIEATIEGKIANYSIVGVSKQKENGAFVSYTYEGQPISIEVPYTTFDRFETNIDEFDDLYIFLEQDADAQKATDDVIHLLDTRHQSMGEDYFLVQSFQDQVKLLNSILNVVTVFISFVAAISLIVGGIGVMNIMLVSVTERTREIGIRKALGARTSSITSQFLFESAILTVIGGIIGIISGIIGAHGICAIITTFAGMEISPGISISTVVTATLFSSLVGIFFGIYPARKAAKLSPIEALRRE